MLEIRGLKHLEFLNCNDVTGLFDTQSSNFVATILRLLVMGSKCCSGGMAGRIPVAIL